MNTINDHIKSTEDYKFRAELTRIGRDIVLFVTCKLFLPKEVRDRPRLIFFPDTNAFHTLGRVGSCELRGTLGEEGHPGSITIIATEVRIGSGNQRCWENGLDEGYILGHPNQIRIIRNMGKIFDKEWAIFYLTESRLLSPFDLQTYSYDGSVEVEHVHKIQFPLNEDFQLSFEYEYRNDLNSGKEKKIWSELIARADIDRLPANTTPEVLLPLIDDLLLLVSLAEGQRCVCMEMAWSQKNQLVRLFRLDRVMPEENPNHSFNSHLIGNAGDEFEPFLQQSYTTLQKFPERNLLCSALASVTYFDSSTIGDEFLRLFTALETLVLAFRRMNDLEFAVQNDSERKEIKKDIEKFLKEHKFLKNDPTCRSRLYENLPGLFRISLKQATETFIKKYDVKLDDVWPLFDRSSGWSLLDIRNKIAHGEHFSEGEWFDIMEAKASLKVIVQRLLLSQLGWNYQKSKAHWGNSIRKNWASTQANLSVPKKMR